MPDTQMYSYVSLFGMTDLASLKDALFESAAPLKSLAPQSQPPANVERSDGVGIGIRKKAAAMVASAKRHSKLFEQVPGLSDFGPFLRSAAFLTVSRYVICIDDVERRSDNLPLKEVLGLLSLLREQRGCRVVVVLNSDSLTEVDRREFESYREKVFDYEILFEPTAEESAAIAFPSTSPMYVTAAKRAASLNIQNIRVLSRIRRLIDLMYPLVVSLDERVLEQIIQSAVLLTWSYNTRDENAPPFAYLRSLNHGSFLEMPPTLVISDEAKVWNSLLRDYGYDNTDDLDAEICKYLERGFLDIGRIKSVIENGHAAAVRLKIENAFSDCWELVRQGFADNLDTIVEAFREHMPPAARWTSIHNADAVTSFLREVGRADVADELGAQWVATQLESNPRALDLDRSEFRWHLRDAALLEQVRASSKGVNPDPSLREVAEGLSKLLGWGPVDVRVMNRATEQEYFELLKSLDGPNARMVVKGLYQFAEIGNSSEEYREIGEKVVAALARIAEESPLNSLRVSMLDSRRLVG